MLARGDGRGERGGVEDGVVAVHVYEVEGEERGEEVGGREGGGGEGGEVVLDEGLEPLWYGVRYPGRGGKKLEDEV